LDSCDFITLILVLPFFLPEFLKDKIENFIYFVKICYNKEKINGKIAIVSGESNLYVSDFSKKESLFYPDKIKINNISNENNIAQIIVSPQWTNGNSKIIFLTQMSFLPPYSHECSVNSFFFNITDKKIEDKKKLLKRINFRDFKKPLLSPDSNKILLVIYNAKNSIIKIFDKKFCLIDTINNLQIHKHSKVMWSYNKSNEFLFFSDSLTFNQFNIKNSSLKTTILKKPIILSEDMILDPNGSLIFFKNKNNLECLNLENLEISTVKEKISHRFKIIGFLKNTNFLLLKSKGNRYFKFYYLNSALWILNIKNKQIFRVTKSFTYGFQDACIL
jgi:hypothetical protein